MGTLNIFKTLYKDSFKNLTNILLSSYLKVLTWGSLSLIGVIVYAFVYRLATGFSF